jgi:TolB protein
MRKRTTKSAELMSQGRVEYLEQWRQRRISKKLRRTAVLVIVLAIAVACITGAVGNSISRVQDTLDSVRIAMLATQTYPQQTGLFTLYQVEALEDGFVALGEEGCVVYSESGNRLNSIQTGYARPAIAVGKNRYVLYNRSGNELRVESRTQNLYTKTMDSNIFLCAVSDGGLVAVATEDIRHVAVLTIYSAEMEQLLQWSMTSTEGTPLRMAFASDNKRLAVAAVTTQDGQALTNLYILDTRKDQEVHLDAVAGSMPQWVGWLSSSEILVIFDDHASVYSSSGNEKSRYDFSDETLCSVSVNDNGIALLFESGQNSHALLLKKDLTEQYSDDVPSANKIVRGSDSFYLLSDDAVECFSLDGTYQWSSMQDAKPLDLLIGKKRTLLFSTNIVTTVQAPEQEE